jgi:hypothetical protein
LSLTVVNDQGLSPKDLKERLVQEIRQDLAMEPLSLIKHYEISKALPDLPNMKYDIDYTATQLTPSTFLAGDQLLNPSLNAAMISGERVAEAVNNRIKGIST